MADPENVVPDEVSAEEPTSEEPSSQGDELSNQPAVLASELMKDPIMLAALQDKLGSMVGGSSGYIQSLPKPVKRRIKALKKIQFEATKIEAEFYREVHRLECEYANKYTPLCEKRSTIVTGNYEPNDEDADWPSDDEKDDELAKDSDDVGSGDNKDEVKKASLEDKTEENAEDKDEKAEDAKGIPGFWLTIFKNVDMLSEMIQPHDEPILNHLQDIKVEFKEKDPMGFTLEFVFDENEYFDNKKLTKAYVMRSEPEKDDPFSFEGPEIIKCTGCKIDWKKGKNVTVKTVKKKQKHKASGTTRTIQKTVQSDSFFNFFSPPTPPEDEEMDEDTEALLAADFEIGHFIRERIVPRAVLYFTGEALENEDDDEYGEEEDGEEGDYDEDADPDYSPGQGKYLSPEFQARCAALALGRQSMPSSAPCDTRLALRPSSSSELRQDIPQNNRKSRPNTAPIRTPLSVTQQNSDSNLTKPDVNSEAFTASGSNIPKQKNVTFDKNLLNLPVVGSFVREGTEIVLPNALQAEAVIETGDSNVPKLEREKTFISNSKPSLKAKPPVPMSREKSFIQKNAASGMKLQKKILHQHKEEALDSVEECTDNEAEAIDMIDIDNVKDEQSQSFPTTHSAGKGSEIKQKSDISENSKNVARSKNSRQVASTSKNISGNVKSVQRGYSAANARRDEGSGKIKAVSDPKYAGRSHEIKSASTSSSKQRDDLSGSRGQTSLNETSGASQTRRGEETDKTKTKDTAYNILKKLTGKNRQTGSGGHKAGMVPNVSKPKKRYKFTEPSESSGQQNVEPAKDQGLHEPAVKGESGPNVKHKYSYRGHGQFQIEAVYDKKGPQAKPVSAPARHASQRAGQTGSAPVRSHQQKGHSGSSSISPGNTDEKGSVYRMDASKRHGQTASAPGRRTGQQSSADVKNPQQKIGHDTMHGAQQVDNQSAGKNVNRNQSRGQRSGGSHGQSHRHGDKISQSLKAEQKLDLPEDDFNIPAELRQDRSAENVRKKQGEDSRPVKSEKGSEIMHPKEIKSDTVPSASRRKGVRIQNGMISTSVEASNNPASPDLDLDQGQNLRGSTPSNIHPKLQDSPYLRDNPLLQSGKHRRRQGGGSAHSESLGDGTE